MLVEGVGAEGQERLARGHAVIVGCGALGCGVADLLARAGIGRLTIIDRDVVEETNLQRQCLLDERHLREGLPKAEAARRRLAEINSGVRVEAHVADLHAGSLATLLPEIAGEPGPGATGGATVLIDGTDNFPTRLLLNDLAVRQGIPYIYAGVLATRAMVLAVVPGSGRACLRCILPEPPAPGSVATCDTAGVLGPAVGVATSLQAAEAMKVLLGLADRVSADLVEIDVWSGAMRCIPAAGLRDPACGCCGRGDFVWLDPSRQPPTATLCGRDAVQVMARTGGAADLAAIGARLARVGRVEANAYLVRFAAPEGVTITLFRDGRALVGGVESVERARAVVDRYVGA